MEIVPLVTHQFDGTERLVKFLSAFGADGEGLLWLKVLNHSFCRIIGVVDRLVKDKQLTL